MAFHDLEVDVALEAMSPCMQKLLKTAKPPAKRGNSRKARLRPNSIQKPFPPYPMRKEQTPSRLRSHSAKHQPLFNDDALWPYSRSRSPSPSCRSYSRNSHKEQSYKDEHDRDSEDTRSARSVRKGRDEEYNVPDYLRLPLLKQQIDNLKVSPQEKGRLAAATKEALILPPISGRRAGDLDRNSIGEPNNYSSEQSMDIEDTIERAQIAIRHDLMRLKSTRDVKTQCKNARRSLRPAMCQNAAYHPGGLANTLHHLLETHMPGVPNDVRRASLLAVLHSEESRRVSKLEEKENGDVPASSSPKVATRPAKRATIANHTCRGRRHAHLAHRSVLKKTATAEALPGRHSASPGEESVAYGPAHVRFAPNSGDNFRTGGFRTGGAEETKDSVSASESQLSGTVHKRSVDIIFQKFADDGAIHHDDMARVLEHLGFIPRQHLVDEAFKRVTKHTTVRPDGFEKFLKIYVAQQKEFYEEAFYAADLDQSGTIDIKELITLLPQFGIEPLPYVLKEVLQEVDEDKSGVVELNEFLKVIDTVTLRAGFSSADYKRLIAAYHKFDFDASGEINKQEFLYLMVFLGLTYDPETVEQLLQEFDHDGNTTMSEREFLICMRSLRKRELDKVKAVIGVQDPDGDITLNGDQALKILRDMGYFPTPAAFQDAAKEVDLDPTSDLELSEFWQLLQTYRSREGFCDADLEDIEETFARYSALGFLSAQDLDVALRFMGYGLPFENLRLLTYQVDLDMSGQLDYLEFRKLLRICRDRDIQKLRKLFDEHAFHGLVKPKDAAVLLSACNFHDAAGEPPTITADDVHPSSRGLTHSVDIFDLVKVMIDLTWHRRNFARDHWGFTLAEVAEQRVSYQEADADESGAIESKETVDLLDALFPEMSSDFAVRQQLVQVINDVGMECHGCLDFQAFLQLMRKCSDMQNLARFDKEKRVIEETGFSPTEINEFRELFVKSDMNYDTELSLSEVMKMIADICPMGQKNTESLTSIFYRITDRQQQVEGRRDHADFPEFLYLWYQLLEINFAGIREATAARTPTTDDTVLS